jgi:hypothetical protein
MEQDEQNSSAKNAKEKVGDAKEKLLGDAKEKVRDVKETLLGGEGDKEHDDEMGRPPDDRSPLT